VISSMALHRSQTIIWWCISQTNASDLCHKLDLKMQLTSVPGIMDLPFRIMTCRFLLAIVSRTWNLICINLSFASRDFVGARSAVSAFHCVRANDLDFTFLHWNLSAWTPRIQWVELCIASVRTTLAVSIVAPL